MGGNPWIRRRGSRLWDPKTGRATLLPPVIDQPNGSVAFLHSSSKSSGTAREWFFVLARPRLRTNYCRSPVTLLAKFSLWTVPGGIRAGAVFHPYAPSVFLPLKPRPGSFAVAAAGNEGPIPRPEKQTGCRKAIAQRVPWDDLAQFIDIVASQREDAVGAEAHRNRFPRCSRTCSPFPRSGIP